MFNIPALVGPPIDAAFTYPYLINQSALFDVSSTTRMVNGTFADPNHSDQVAFSGWVKRAVLGTAQTIFSGSENSSNYGFLRFNAVDKLSIKNQQGGATNGICSSDAVLRDCAGWYHIFMMLDNTLANDAARFQLWVNGVQLALTFTDATVLNGNLNFFRDNDDVELGRDSRTNTDYFNGLMAEVHYFHDKSLAATDFGEFQNGIWVPKAYAGSYGALVDAYMDFSNSADFGEDQSGQNNDMTATNMDSDHQFLDTPTNNFCTLDANLSYISGYSYDGGLAVSWPNSNWRGGMGNFLMKTGKWYWEVKLWGADLDRGQLGICSVGEQSGDAASGVPSWELSQAPDGQSAFLWYMTANQYTTYTNGATTTHDPSNLGAPAQNDYVQIAFDADANKIWFGVNNVWAHDGSGVGDPAAGTYPAWDGTNENIDAQKYDYVPAVGMYWITSFGVLFNFGQRAFNYTPPTGFLSLSAGNRAEPPVLESNTGIDVLTYTGDGADPRSFTDLAFRPDFVWFKERSEARSHHIYDSVRGPLKPIYPDGTFVEGLNTDGLESFDASGFTVGDSVAVNKDTETYVALCLRMGVKYGFDIQTFLGTEIAHTESHDLGGVPELMLLKNLDATDSWNMYHHHLLNKTDPETDMGRLDLTNAWLDADKWNDTAPTSSVFSVSSAQSVNGDGENIIAYLWRSIEGFSKVFSYEGNGNVLGPSVSCGFRPRWILVKRGDGVENWEMMDTARDTINPVKLILNPNGTTAEGTRDPTIDITSNGFMVRTTNAAWNFDGHTYGGIAFAEQPGKYSNAR